MVFDRVVSRSPLHEAIKRVAAALVRVSLAGAFNLASAAIPAFFLCASLVGIAQHVGPPPQAA